VDSMKKACMFIDLYIKIMLMTAIISYNVVIQFWIVEVFKGGLHA